MFFVNSKPEKFEHGGFTLITHQMLSVHTSLEKFENTTIANHCGFVCEETDWATENNEFIVEIFYREKFLKSASEKLRFRVGLVWTVGLIVEIKLCFRDGLVWTVGLTVEIKLCFRDGLVWTVGITVEINGCVFKFLRSEELRFRDGLVWTEGLTVEIKLRFQIPPA